jgi:hypothetical protein
MPGRRWLLLAAGVVALAALVTGRLYVFPPSRLGPIDGGTETGLSESKPHDWLDVFIGGFEPHGPDDVHVRAVRVTGVPRGLRVIGVHALDGGPSAGNETGDLQQKFPGRFDYRPVTEMVFRPGQPERWTLLIVVEALEPGEWHTTGFDIDWSAGWYRGTTHYDYKVGMKVQAP